MEGHSGPQTIENVFQRTHFPTLLGDLQNTSRNQVRTIVITDLLTKTSTFYLLHRPSDIPACRKCDEIE